VECLIEKKFLTISLFGVYVQSFYLVLGFINCTFGDTIPGKLL